MFVFRYILPVFFSWPGTDSWLLFYYILENVHTRLRGWLKLTIRHDDVVLYKLKLGLRDIQMFALFVAILSFGGMHQKFMLFVSVLRARFVYLFGLISHFTYAWKRISCTMSLQQ